LIVLKLAGIGGGVVGLILIILCWISPLGMKSITLPFPYFQTIFFQMIYNLLFMALYYVALPAAEVAYYTIFLQELVPQGNEMIANFFIAGAYAGMNWFAIVWIVKRFFAQLFVTGLAFGVMFGILTLKKKKGLPIAVTARYALGFAILFWMIWMAMTRKGWMHRSQPEFYFNGTTSNIWGVSA
jgi:hypothetical protein